MQRMGVGKKVDPTGVLMEQIVIKESNKRFFFTPCGNFLSVISITEPHYIFSMILKLNHNTDRILGKGLPRFLKTNVIFQNSQSI